MNDDLTKSHLPPCRHETTDASDSRVVAIHNEVFMIIWSTVIATGETTLRVTCNGRIGAWVVDRNSSQFKSVQEGVPSFSAWSDGEAIEEAVYALGGKLGGCWNE